jgi:hypothetical protein
MSPELEILDQLLGGDLPLSVVRSLFNDEGRFARGVLALLRIGEVRLLAADGREVPRWKWPEALGPGSDETEARLSITPAGASRVG